MRVTSDLFRQAMGQFATGVTVVTTCNNRGEPYGLTVNSFTSVSLNPPLVLVCLDRDLSGLASFKESGQFAVNILAEDQRETSHFFASRGSERQHFPYGKGQTGVPVLSEALARLECRAVEFYPGGDHEIMLGEVLEVTFSEEGAEKPPLLFFRGRYRKLDCSSG